VGLVSLVYPPSAAQRSTRAPSRSRSEYRKPLGSAKVATVRPTNNHAPGPNGSPGKRRVDDVAEPDPGPGDVVVRVAACGICGSDLSYPHVDRLRMRVHSPVTRLSNAEGLLARPKGLRSPRQPGDDQRNGEQVARPSS
jgi:hypothetical protein